MYKFIKRLVLFSSPVLVGMIVFEILLKSIPNDYSFKSDYLDKKSNTVEVLFLGNSHFYFGINPIHITRKSFNGAHVSQSLNYDFAILEKYKEQWGNLKYIIIPIDYFSMYSSIEDTKENWRVKNYSIYYDIHINKSYWTSFEVFNDKFSNNASRVIKYFFYQESDIACNKLGFGTYHKSKDSKNLFQTGEAAAKRHTVHIENNMSFSKNVKTIHSIIAFAKKQNSIIIFVTCPAYYTYKENLEPNQLNSTLNTIEQLVANNPNTYYYNFLTDTTFVAADYYDGDHLNDIGAKKLTLKIDRILNTLENANAKQ
jgi:hypothetical protein